MLYECTSSVLLYASAYQQVDDCEDNILRRDNENRKQINANFSNNFDYYSSIESILDSNAI